MTAKKEAFVQPTFVIVPLEQQTEEWKKEVQAFIRNECENARTGPVLVATSMNLIVPREHWVDYLTREVDIFSRDYIGYWAFGARPLLPDGSDDKTRWFAIEEGDESLGGRAIDNRIMKASNALMAGEPLPKNVYLLDEAAAIRAYVIACQRWGPDWMNGAYGDANGYDIAIQLALLGEIRYG